MAVVVPRALVFPNVGETRWNNDEAVLGNPFQLSHGKTDASDSFMEGLRKGGGRRGRGRSSIEANTRVLFTRREITVERSQKGKFVVTFGSDNLLAF